MTPEAAQKDYMKAVAKQNQRPHIAFTILGAPIGKQRARVNAGHLREAMRNMIRILYARNVSAPAMAIRVGRQALQRRVGSYTPKKTADYERHITACAQAAVLKWRTERPSRMPADLWPTSEEVFCDTWIYLNKGPWPDAGNVSKAVVDACAGVLWISASGKPDDSRVLERQQARIEHSLRPRVDVLVSFVEK